MPSLKHSIHVWGIRWYVLSLDHLFLQEIIKPGAKLLPVVGQNDTWLGNEAEQFMHCLNHAVLLLVSHWNCEGELSEHADACECDIVTLGACGESGDNIDCDFLKLPLGRYGVQKWE